MIKADFAAEGRRLKAKFEKAPIILEDRLDEKIYKIAKQVEADAVLNAPVKTGRLRNSIGTRKISKQLYEVGTVLDYALYVHEGTKYITPNPFLYRALTKNVPALLKATKKAADDLI